MKVKQFTILLFVILMTYPVFAHKEIRNVTDFDQVNLAISAECLLIQGNAPQLILEGDAEVLEQVVTEVSGSCLRVNYRKPIIFKNTKRIKVYLTVDQLRFFRISGSANVYAKECIAASDLSLHVSGSGDFSLQVLKVEDLLVHISGSGSVNIAGSDMAKNLEVQISGSGKYVGDNIEFRTADVVISGSGNCKVVANDWIKVRVSGSGNVYYRGGAVIDAKVSGSGRVHSF